MDYKKLLMDNKALSIAVVVALLFLVLYITKPCPCASDEYIDGLKIMDERIVGRTIIPIDYGQLNQVIGNHTTCPVGIDCEIKDTKFINIYGDYTEQERLILMTKIVDALYESMPFLYDRTLGFIFKNERLETTDEIYVESNKWSRRYN